MEGTTVAKWGRTKWKGGSLLRKKRGDFILGFRKKLKSTG
jgi:hypothetical protein